MDGSAIGKWIIFFGIGITVVGILVWAGSKVGIPIGRFPGDIRLQKDKFALYVPLVTCLVLSLFLTLIVNLIMWLFRRY